MRAAPRWTIRLVAAALSLAGCDEADAPAAVPTPRAETAPVPAPSPVPPVPPSPVLGTGMPPPGATGTIGLGTIGTIGRGTGGALSSASVRTGEATLTGGPFSRDLVRRVVRRHIAEVHHCYEAQLVPAPDLAGRVTARWVIEPDGAVSGAEIESSTLASAAAHDGGASALAVGTCIAESVATWVFPAPEGAAVHVSYPFVLELPLPAHGASGPGALAPEATEGASELLGTGRGGS